jgi:hypothetical protein
MDNLNPIERVILRKYTMNFIKAHYKAIIAILTPIIVFLTPSLHAAATNNPHTALGVVCGCVLTAWANRSLLQS